MKQQLAIINIATKQSNPYYELPADAKLGDTFELNSKQRFVVVTKEQALAFRRVMREQVPPGSKSDCQRVYYDYLLGCLIVSFPNILIGIESDGYAHS